MKNLILLAFSLFFVSLAAKADVAPSHIRGLLALGAEFRPEKDVAGDYSNQTLQNWAVGFGFDEYLITFERGTYKIDSGNSTLHVDRGFEDYLLWGDWRGAKWTELVPFLGVGVGAYQETVTTRLSGISASDSSEHKLLLGFNFGLSLELPVIWLSLEARIFFGDELQSQPQLGGLGRIGLWF